MLTYTRGGWKKATKYVIETRSRFGHRAKGMTFLACDDGSRICFACASPVDTRADERGPVTKHGECGNCGLKIVAL